MYIILITRMARGIVSRIFYTFPFALLRKQVLANPNSSDIRVIRANEDEIFRSASVVAAAFAISMILLISFFQGLANPGIVVAGVFLALGISQQIISVSMDVISSDMRAFISRWNTVIHLLARAKGGLEWRFIEDEATKIFIYPHILYTLPQVLGIGKVRIGELLGYIDRNRGEIGYSRKVGEDEPSQLSFSTQALDHIKERLDVHDRMYDSELKTGAIDPILFLAIGTIIWLLSS
ncbi:MAG: hypothetical protein O7B30_02625 [Thaumarchaeota archaeon]|nr:hypothetical protein [Nitrososphaerota archaeon]